MRRLFESLKSNDSTNSCYHRPQTPHRTPPVCYPQLLAPTRRVAAQERARRKRKRKRDVSTGDGPRRGCGGA
eukprot:885076-Rhodomonas_salina.1